MYEMFRRLFDLRQTEQIQYLSCLQTRIQPSVTRINIRYSSFKKPSSSLPDPYINAVGKFLIDIGSKGTNSSKVHSVIVKSNADGTFQDKELLQENPCYFITVSICLDREFGLNSHRPAEKPYLTPVVKKRLLDFARRHCQWTLAK